MLSPVKANSKDCPVSEQVQTGLQGNELSPFFSGNSQDLHVLGSYRLCSTILSQGAFLSHKRNSHACCIRQEGDRGHGPSAGVQSPGGLSHIPVQACLSANAERLGDTYT